MHEVSVSSDFLDLSITVIFLLSFLINLKQFLLPFYFHEVKKQLTVYSAVRRWCLRTNPSPTQRLYPDGDRVQFERLTTPRLAPKVTSKSNWHTQQQQPFLKEGVRSSCSQHAPSSTSDIGTHISVKRILEQ